MKKYYYTIITILFFGLLSCSNEETKTEKQSAARPTVPLQNGEVQIGTQIWMTRNLNVSRYRNGDLIPQVTDPTQWANLTTGAWCYYNNDPANGLIYGKLYNWYAVNDTRGLAPSGWHIPSEVDWFELTSFIGGDNIAGTKMKSTTLWAIPNSLATNSSGFTGLPGGYRNISFNNINRHGCWWSSREILTNNAEYIYVVNSSSRANRTINTKRNGYSVRCLKD
jgi:uncharacterized protein (TIGR02145 family)